jgi:hypothetical protein
VIFMASAPTRSQIGYFPLNAFNITPDDDKQYAGGVAVFVNGGGDVTVEPLGGGAPVTYSLDSGAWVGVMCRKVLASGTTATGLVGHN